MTKIQIMPAWKDVKPAGNYVYIHRRLSDKTEFYVGLGRGQRGWAVSRKNRGAWWHNVASKNGVIIEVVQDGMKRSDAVLLEIWLIAKFRHEGRRIVNITDGGEGCLGFVPGNAIPVNCSSGDRFETYHEAARWLQEYGVKNADVSAISRAARGVHNSAYGFAWWHDDDEEKKFIKKSSRRRETMARAVRCSNGMLFSDTRDAADWCISEGLSRVVTYSIKKACDSDTGYAYGLYWWWEGNEEREVVDSRRIFADARYRSVSCSNGMTFQTTGRAEEWLWASGYPMASQANIRNAIKTGRAAYGLKWEYEKDDT